MEEAMQTALAAMAVAAPAIYFSPWLWRRLRMSRIQKHAEAKRMLTLTYDDGPSVALTQPLLDLLHRSAARASFFMLGRHARQYSGIADRAHRRLREARRIEEQTCRNVALRIAPSHHVDARRLRR